jgi:hypothetical protein
MVLKREISLSGSLQQRRLTEPNTEATLVLMWNFETFFGGWGGAAQESVLQLAANLCSHIRGRGIGMACSSGEPRYKLIAKDLQTASLSFVELSSARSLRIP